MRRRRAAVAAAAVLILLAGGWYYGSPWWTLWRMREAARAGDMARLDEYVDLAAIGKAAARDAREGWSSILRDGPADPASRRRLVALGRRKLGEAAAGKSPIFDFRPWLAGMPIPLAGRDGVEPGARPYIIHRGLDSFEVRQQGADRDNGPMLTFRRHGLGWKLSGVRWGQQ